MQLVFDRDPARAGGVGKLYVADTGNARIVEVDASTAVAGDPVRGWEHGVKITGETSATVRDVVPPHGHDLQAPSGIALFGELFCVTDNATSTIQAFDRDGNEVDYLEVDLPEGSLTGIRVYDSGHVWLTDDIANRVLRIRPVP